MRCFVISDCEGYESVLFDAAVVEALRHSDVLIEMHGDACLTVPDRFSKSHDLHTVTSSDHSASDYPELACLGECGPRAVAEHRAERQRWLYASSREREDL